MSTKGTKRAARVIANAGIKSAPQLSPIQAGNDKRLGSAKPRSRRTTPRSRRTTPRRQQKSLSLSPVNRHKPKTSADMSFLDRLASRASRKQARPKTAGPVACSASGRWSRPGGGRFSTAKPKTETDWIIKRSKETPGPGQYTPKMIRKKSGCKISDANPKSDVELVMLRSRETPGPSAYQSNISTNSGKGLKISDANPKSDLDWVIYRSKQSPGYVYFFVFVFVFVFIFLLFFSSFLFFPFLFFGIVANITSYQHILPACIH